MYTVTMSENEVNFLLDNLYHQKKYETKTIGNATSLYGKLLTAKFGDTSSDMYSTYGHTDEAETSAPLTDLDYLTQTIEETFDQSTVQHRPVFDAEKIAKHYEEKDGVKIRYVCTTDLRSSDRPYDVFYRETPHPEFGNRYFGLCNFTDITGKSSMIITNADVIEDLEFGMITDREGNLHYSRSHHDYQTINGQIIDGGRVYIRGSGSIVVMKVKDGKFVYKSSM